MRIGLFQHGWWEAACESGKYATTGLPTTVPPSGNPYESDLPARIANSEAVLRRLQERPVELLLDNGGAGLGFLASDGKTDNLDLLHERLRLPLASHLVDPLVTALQGLDWPVVWQSLQSAMWVKFIWDRAHAAELQRFGVPSVVHLPMGAPVRAYCTEPLDARHCKPVVSFVGGQNSKFFAQGNQIATARLLPGAMTLGLQADLRNTSFFDAYHDVYGLGQPLAEGDDLETRFRKTAAYFNLKEFYHAGLCLRQRDRFVVFLKRKLGDHFRLIGTRWEEAYGLRCEQPLPTADAYFNHFRETAINLNFVNGNAESGLNLRHFEITAAGGFMLCYDQPELSDCFDVGKECAVFRSETDLLDKIRYYLTRPQERAAIAVAGQRRTLAQHLFSRRLETVLKYALPLTRAYPVEYSKSSIDVDLRAILPAADVILDGGANTGQAAAWLRGLYPRATIYSFEPVGSLYAQLCARAAELRIQPVKKGLADFDGRATIHLTSSPEAHSLLGFQPGNPCAPWTNVVGCEEVEVCTLDRWCRDAGVDSKRVNLLKLDIQGAELKALYGARNLLKTVKAVYLEVSFVPIYRDAPLFADIETFMRECGYRRYAVYPSDQPHYWGDALYIREDGARKGPTGES